MKWWMLPLSLMVLCGCAARPAWETVDDDLSGAPAAYEMQLALPEQAVELESRQGENLYGVGAMEVTTAAFAAKDLDAAVRYLSGFAAERLTILQTQRFDMPEYQFAWYSQSDEGGRLCRADLVMDGMQCYAVVCTAPEGEDAFARQCQQVFSTFGLFVPELV